MALIKAIPLGVLLTFVVTLFMGSAGSSGGLLDIQRIHVLDYQLFWSWPLFLVSTGLAWGILWLMDS